MEEDIKTNEPLLEENIAKELDIYVCFYLFIFDKVYFDGIVKNIPLVYSMIWALSNIRQT